VHHRRRKRVPRRSHAALSPSVRRGEIFNAFLLADIFFSKFTF
jgi:hypothetical protein